MATITVRYSHNNSGGRDWLTTADWHALAAAGWVLDPFEGDRYFGADRQGLTLDEAIAEWQAITGQDHTAEGCTCCGNPHYFYADEEH